MRGVVLALAIGVASAGCPSYTNCADCLSPDNGFDCGWCTPDPVVFGNGTQATQCIDHTSDGWVCENLYMHDGCVAGYVCNTTTGTCDLADPGQGDTLAHCEESCSVDPPPEKTYKCDVENFTCVEADSSYSESSCNDACEDNTPSALVGLWRGLNVQTGFEQGEWVMNFSSSSVAWGPLGDSQSMVADVALIAPMLLRLTITSPAEEVGNYVYASYTNPGYPTGPETSSMSIAIQADGSKQTPPTNVLDAMGDTQFNVFVVNRCNSWDQVNCDFSSVFDDAQNLVKKQKADEEEEKKKHITVGDDQCLGYSDCDSCLSDSSGVCGWCDGIITDTDGNVVCGDDGYGCCGGSDGFSQCNVAYRKICPVICDWTNWTDPSCRAATTPEYLSQDTYNSCDDIPWCTGTTYQYCDTTSESCKTLYNEADCEAEPDCDPSNPVCDSSVCTKINYIWCDEVLGCQSTDNATICAQTDGCDPDDPGSCNPNECQAQSYYECDESTYTCNLVVGPYPPTPYFNTSTDCTAACVDTDVSGIWRAIRIDDGFVADEWDFNLGATSITFASIASGDSYTGTYVVGDPISSSSTTAASITVTLDDGSVLEGIVSIQDDNSNGPVTKFMYMGLPLTAGDSTDSFDDAMSTDNQQFVMIACLDDGIEQGCDFSSADPTA
jgi:hypothetical protein